MIHGADFRPTDTGCGVAHVLETIVPGIALYLPDRVIIARMRDRRDSRFSLVGSRSAVASAGRGGLAAGACEACPQASFRAQKRLLDLITEIIERPEARSLG